MFRRAACSTHGAFAPLNQLNPVDIQFAIFIGPTFTNPLQESTPVFALLSPTGQSTFAFGSGQYDSASGISSAGIDPGYASGIDELEVGMANFNSTDPRCGLSDRVTFEIGDALHLPFEDAAFDAVFLQHVAMNVEDRAALYAEVCRILTPGGRLATYDLVQLLHGSRR